MLPQHHASLQRSRPVSLSPTLSLYLTLARRSLAAAYIRARALLAARVSSSHMGMQMLPESRVDLQRVQEVEKRVRCSLAQALVLTGSARLHEGILHSVEEEASTGGEDKSTSSCISSLHPHAHPHDRLLILIVGVPGSGKTSLLRRFARVIIALHDQVSMADAMLCLAQTCGGPAAVAQEREAAAAQLLTCQQVATGRPLRRQPCLRVGRRDEVAACGQERVESNLEPGCRERRRVEQEVCGADDLRREANAADVLVHSQYLHRWDVSAPPRLVDLSLPQGVDLPSRRAVPGEQQRMR
eukprot:765022-Hanusia_phi.AAC.4